MSYAYFTRDDWGARPVRRRARRNTGVTTFVVHHTAERNKPSYAELVESTKRPGVRWYLSPKRHQANSAIAKAIKAYEKGHSDIVELEKAAMRRIQAYHMDTNGWSDIGYHEVIFPSGHVYEGRAYDSYGAHAINGNHMFGISFAANTELERLTPQAIDAYRERLSVRGLKPGNGRGHYRVPGNSTACPGKNAKSQLEV